MYARRAMIIGATGIVGLNLAEYLRMQGGWSIYGVSRRPPLGASYIKSIQVDLLNHEKAATALSHFAPTHIYYCTWALGKNEDENIQLNVSMLRTVLDIFKDKSSIQHVAIVTGAKHYLGPFEDYGKVNPITPFREYAPRLTKKNFYYEQEDLLMEYSAKHGFSWSVHRANTIIGYAIGNLMNIGATLATYASICKDSGRPFRFPGSPTAYNGLNDITDARLLAKQIVWASTEPNAHNEAFNAANGDVFRWKQLWKTIADYFNLEVALYPGEYNSLEEQMVDAGPIWDKLVKQHGLQVNPLSRLASAWHTDLDLGRPMECINSMTKSRVLGFREYQDTEQSFIDVFDRLRAERIIP